MNKTKAPKAFIFIGRSGCGKGTQVELFKKKLEKRSGKKTLRIETGEMMRKFVKGNSYTQKLSKKIIEAGGLMPESVIVNSWMQYLVNHFTGKENLIFDGAPRKIREAEMLDNTLKFYGIHSCAMIYLDVSSKWATARLLARKRKDDTPKRIKERLSWFEKEVVKSIGFFKKNKNCKFLRINGEQTIEEVHKEIMKKIGW